MLRQSSFARFASLAIFWMTSAAPGPAMAEDYARASEPSGICWKKVCVERYTSSAGTRLGRCKRYATALTFKFNKLPKSGHPAENSL